MKQQKVLYGPSWIDNFFSDDQLNEIIKIGENNNLENAKVGTNEFDGQINFSARRTLVSWIDPKIAPYWFAKSVEKLFVQMNDEHYKFHLTGAEPAQYTKYESHDSGEYKWHQDTTEFLQEGIRKLSCSILLSDPLEYEGGNLILAPDGNPITVGDKKGRAIFFPSWVPHCVTPITKGVRKSLVIWAHGPMFK
jgi:PKHD-type hydroxylase